MFMLQFKKPAKDGKWSRANWFTRNWSQANPGKNAAEWYQSDARVKTELKQTGVLGIPGLKPPKE